MAHYAKIIDGVVVLVTVVNNAVITVDGIEDGTIGEEFCANLLGGEWVQTSYNTSGNIHKLGGVPFRKNYAGVGSTYDAVLNAFIAPKPHPSWVLDEETCWWGAPVARPATGQWVWDEATLGWVAL